MQGFVIKAKPGIKPGLKDFVKIFRRTQSEMKIIYDM